MTAHDWQAIALPPRIAALERDARGYPVPYIVLRDADGPHFAVNDVLLVARAIRERLCHICGQPLDALAWFTGGPGAALLNGAAAFYIDGPMHDECMRYAMAVCPHLSHRMTKPVPDSTFDPLLERGVALLSMTTIPGVPEIFVAVQSARWTTTTDPLRGRIFKVPKPFRRTAYWQDGALLPLDKGRRAAQRAADALATRLRTEATT